jgi:hypothetical protein
MTAYFDEKDADYVGAPLHFAVRLFEWVVWYCVFGPEGKLMKAQHRFTFFVQRGQLGNFRPSRMLKNT